MSVWSRCVGRWGNRWECVLGRGRGGKATGSGGVGKRQWMSERVGAGGPLLLRAARGLLVAGGPLERLAGVPADLLVVHEQEAQRQRELLIERLRCSSGGTGSAASASAARLADDSGWRRLAFYNIGWDKKSKKHNMTLLAREIWNIVHAKCIDAIGISEVFNLRDDAMRKERQNILQHLLATLNCSAAQPPSTVQATAKDSSTSIGSAVQPATSLRSAEESNPKKAQRYHSHEVSATQPAIDNDFSMAFITTRPDPEPAILDAIDSGARIVIVCLPRSAKNDTKRLERLHRDFNFAASTQDLVALYDESFCNLIAAKIVEPEHGLPAQLFTFNFPGGSFVLMTLNWPSLPSRARKRLLQAHIEVAKEACPFPCSGIVIGGCLSIPPLVLEHDVLECDHSFHVEYGREPCAEVPAVLACKMKFGGIIPKHGGQSLMVLNSPLPKTTAKSVEASGVILKPATPLYHAMIQNISKMENAEFNELMDEMQQRFVFGNVQYIDSFGKWTDKAVPFPVKFENALRVAKEQRDKVIRWRRNLGDDRANQAVLSSSISLNACEAWPHACPRACLLYTSPSPRDLSTSRMPSSA